jgi:hypothetical protein
MSYTLQLPATIIDDAKMYASSCGTTLAQLLKLYVLTFRSNVDYI